MWGCALLAATVFGEGDGEFASPGKDKGGDVGEAGVLVHPEALVGQGTEGLFDFAIHILLGVVHVDARICIPLHYALLALCKQHALHSVVLQALQVWKEVTRLSEMLLGLA